MTALLVVIIVVAVLLVLGGGYLVAGRVRSRRGGLPPAPSPPAGRQAAEVSDAPAAAEAAAAAPAEVTEVVGAAEAVLEAAPPAEELAPAAPEEAAPVVLGERPKLRDRLGRARGAFGEYLGSLRSRGKIDDSTWEDLEELLILADAGLPTTTKILDDLRARAKAGALPDADSVVTALKEDLVAMFDGEDRQLRRAAVESSPDVWLFVGVNGVGKTTTIGKVAAREAAAGRKVVLAAGDTFRAAAGEQLEVWAERSGGRLIRGADGADPSSVIFDAVQHAASKGADLVLADTAGRLHTKVNLMDELRKVRRVAERPPAQLTEVLLVLDATTGQNGLVQAREFSEAAGVTGVVLTKLDGTAKGGIVLAIRSELGLPIKLVGVGEQIEDLVDFDPVEFVEGLLAE
jgi:fused signal recognition particle receptor